MRIIAGFFLSLILILFLGIEFLVKPNTYLSQINISWWPKPLVKMFLEKKKNEAISVISDARETKIHYGDLGIYLDVDKTMEELKTNEIVRLIDSWLTPSTTLILPVFYFPDDFESKAISLFPSEDLRGDDFNYDEKSGLFEYKTAERKSRIDTVDLLTRLITFTDIKNKPLMVEMVSESSPLEKKINLLNKQLTNIFTDPLELIYNGKQKISISQGELKSIIVPKIDNVDSVTFDIKKDKVAELLKRNQVDLSEVWALSLIKENINKRFSGEKSATILIGDDSGPNSDGTLADRYIEVDLSQQKMFFFENKKLYKTYSVSTGLKYPTPVGNYKIKNKLPMGYSSIFNVWMPWWMAFDYRDDINAYLGIHELPYKLENGQKIYRFGNYIGNRKTGGCIALAPGDSKEVYDNSYPGMDLIIYQ